MIDINELRRLAQAALAAPDGLSAEWMDRLGQFQEAADASVVSELLDRLEAAEKDVALKEKMIDALSSALNAVARELVELRLEISKQQSLTDAAQQVAEAAQRKADKLSARVEAAEKERDALRIENEALRAEIIHIKEVEFPRKAQAVADGWRDKCERLEAKIEQMERQEPVAWLHETRRDSDVVTDAVKHVWGKVAVGSMATYSIPLYALPGAQGE